MQYSKITLSKSVSSFHYSSEGFLATGNPSLTLASKANGKCYKALLTQTQIVATFLTKVINFSSCKVLFRRPKLQL